LFDPFHPTKTFEASLSAVFFQQKIHFLGLGWLIHSISHQTSCKESLLVTLFFDPTLTNSASSGLIDLMEKMLRWSQSGGSNHCRNDALAAFAASCWPSVEGSTSQGGKMSQRHLGEGHRFGEHNGEGFVCQKSPPKKRGKKLGAILVY